MHFLIISNHFGKIPLWLKETDFKRYTYTYNISAFHSAAQYFGLRMLFLLILINLFQTDLLVKLELIFVDVKFWVILFLSPSRVKRNCLTHTYTGPSKYWHFSSRLNCSTIEGFSTNEGFYLVKNNCTMGYEREIDLLINIVLKIWGPLGDISCIWDGRGWYSNILKF